MNNKRGSFAPSEKIQVPYHVLQVFDLEKFQFWSHKNWPKEFVARGFGAHRALADARGILVVQKQKLLPDGKAKPSRTVAAWSTPREKACSKASHSL